MNQISIAFSYGSFAGIFGTVIGCLIGWLLVCSRKKYRKNIGDHLFYARLYEFSSGLMMAIVTFHLLPDAIAVSNLITALLSMLAGLTALFLLGSYFQKKKNKEAIGQMLFTSIMLHNIPEGIAVGSAAVTHPALALSLLIVITIHDIPEGMAACFSLAAKNTGLIKILSYAVLSELPTGAAAILGAYFGSISSQMSAIPLGVASGALLYILIFELSHEAKQHSQSKSADLMYIFGLILGILLK